MREAFTYMFKDPRYSDKATVYFVICFIAFALVGLPEITKLSAIVGTPSITPVTNPLFKLLSTIGKLLLKTVLLGYCYTCIGAIIKQNQNIHQSILYIVLKTL